MKVRSLRSRVPHGDAVRAADHRADGGVARPTSAGAASRPGVRFGPCFDGGKKCATRLANCFQLGVPLRRLSDASPSRFSLLNNHHNLGRLPARTGILHPRLLGQALVRPFPPDLDESSGKDFGCVKYLTRQRNRGGYRYAVENRGGEYVAVRAFDGGRSIFWS